MKYLKKYENKLDFQSFDYQLDEDVEKLVTAFMNIPGSSLSMNDPEIQLLAKKVQSEFDECMGELPKVYGLQKLFDEDTGLPNNLELELYLDVYEGYGESHIRIIWATSDQDSDIWFDEESYIVTELDEMTIQKHIKYHERMLDMYKNPIKVEL